MADPLFSIIMASYQHAHFIGEAMDSVLGQSCGDLELLVTDDGSYDNSWELIQQRVRHDSRVHATRQANRGLNPTLNELVSKSRGTYVTWLGSDDMLMVDRLKWAQKDMEHHRQAMAVFCWADTVDDTGQAVKDGAPDFHFDPTKGTLAYQMLSGNRLCSGAGVIRRDVLTKRSPAFANLAYYQDYELWLSLLAQAELYVRREVGVRYRVHSSNLSRVTPSTQTTHLQEMALCLKHYGPRIIERHAECQHERGPLLGRLGTLHYMLGDYAVAAQNFAAQAELGRLTEEGHLLRISALFNLHHLKEACTLLAKLAPKRASLSATGQIQLDRLSEFSKTSCCKTKA